jgi:transcriptional regulator with GAF, ATPase, and Fis domain
VIAATNRDLLAASKDGKFREDLYYRLNVFPVHLPPLRERADDIPLLVQYLIRKFATRIGKRVEAVSADTMSRFQAYRWPGNVRELENIVERAVILAKSEVLEIDPGTLSPAAVSVAAVPSQPAGASLEAVERDHILATLRSTNWVIDGQSGAAKILSLHPNTLRSRMKKLGISRAGQGRT